MADAAIAAPELTGKAAKKANKKAARASGEAKSGGKKKILLIVALVLVAALGFVVKTKVMAKPAGPVAPVPGAVLPATGMYINLADNHFLKLGLGLQESASAPKTTDASAAQQAAAEASKAMYQEKLAKAGYSAITTEIIPAETFYFAETYHQQYLAKNPNGYCGLGGTGVSCPISLPVAAE